MSSYSFIVMLIRRSVTGKGEPGRPALFDF
ncbi:hypothetical protein ES703_80331 [subsurface metagenome]